jgi:uncharacterized protein YgbK (DUF1537 family)
MTMRAPAFEAQRNPVVTIVADDLTGAADCAAACAARALETIVVLASDGVQEDADAVAIDADTRALLAQAAADKTASISARFADRADLVLFKKLDSTLRGHFAVELAAIVSARRRRFPDSVAIFSAAFPAMGRTTVDGFHLLWGQPLEQTQPWREQDRAGRAFVPQMLSDAGLRTQVLPLRCVRETEAALSATIKRLAPGCDVIACDAETEEDLAALTRASLSLGRQTVWAGSAGLVGHLVDAAGLEGSQPRNSLAAMPGARVFVVGSRSTVSRRQAARFAAREDVEVIDVDPTASAARLDKLDFKQRFCRALDTGKAVLIWQAGEEPAVATKTARQCGDLAAQIAGYKGQIGALFATGGETARCLLEAFGITALRLIDEIEPGIALSVSLGGADLAVVTKAGAFGNDATMAVSLGALSRAAMAPRNSAHHRKVGI